MTERIIGYCLLALGLLIIVFAAFNVFFVFTGKAEPVQLFHTTGVSLDFGSLISAQLPAGARTQVPTQKTEIISADMINQISNLSVHILLMGFLASIGQKLASLGVQLVRPIVVKAKEEIT